MTTADHEASNAPKSKKQTEAENKHIQIGQNRLSRQPKKERRSCDHSDFVMVIDDDFTVGEDLGDHHQKVEGEDDGSGDAEQCKLRQAEARGKQL